MAHVATMAVLAAQANQPLSACSAHTGALANRLMQSNGSWVERGEGGRDSMPHVVYNAFIR